MRAVLANTKAPIRPTHSYSGQHLVQGAAHRRSLFRFKRVHGTHQNFEWVACKRFFALVCQAQTDTSPVRVAELIIVLSLPYFVVRRVLLASGGLCAPRPARQGQRVRGCWRVTDGSVIASGKLTNL